MALKPAIIFLSLIATTTLVWADVPLESYQSIDDTCPARVLKSGSWKPTTAPWKTGDTAMGSPAPGRPQILFLRDQETLYAMSARCWTRLEESAKATESSAPHFVGVAYLGWGETTTLVRQSDSASYPLRAFQSGWGIQHSHDFKRWEKWSIGMSSSAFVTSSSIMPSSKDQSLLGGLSYRSTNAMTWGATIAPEFAWGRFGHDSKLGVSFPIMFRLSNWADTASGSEVYKIQGTQKLLAGALLSYRLESPNWEFSARLGWMGGSSNMAWILGASRRWN